MSAVADPGARAGQTPSSLGFRMPAEWEPHERCIMGWPTQIRIGSVWNEHYLLAMASYAAVAHAIAHFEPVLMIARPGEGAVARSYLGEDVEVVELPLDDSWLRDSGPIFVTRPDGTLALSDFTFNSWGMKYVPYDNDAAIGRRLAEHFGVERFAAPMVLEGGGITVDGQGTLITTESCLLHPSRNPGLTRDEMTQVLKDYLGVEKVIWLISGLGLDEDPDTDGHVDGVGAFVGPGRVLLHMVRDPNHAVRSWSATRRSWRPTSTPTSPTAPSSCQSAGQAPTTWPRSTRCARSFLTTRSSACRAPSSATAAVASTASLSRCRGPSVLADAPRQDQSSRGARSDPEAGRLREVRMLALEGERVVERAHPVVVDAFAVDELEAQVVEAGEAAGLRARR